MDTRSISTSVDISTCDVCGRTLLRGEHAEVYVGGGGRHSVCSLCTSRAVHTGWLREGELPDYDPTAKVDRRRSLLSRFRSRREHVSSTWAAADGRAEAQPDKRSAPPPPVRARVPPAGVALRPGSREPRHVRAVPTSVENRMASAVELFNASEHPRTVAGIGRSLGVPEVTVLTAATIPSVSMVIAWELCWYRYEVDLSDEVPSLRIAAQGYELSELAPEERRCNAVANERGVVRLVR